MNTTFTIIAPDRPASPLTTTFAVGRRTVRKFLRTPQLIVISTVQGAMFLVIFRYVFGGAITTAGAGNYVNFLVPGFVVTTLMFSSILAATGMAEDLEGGFADRLRSLPVGRTSAMAGRAVADTTVTAWGLIVTWAIGFAVGFRTDAPIVHLLAAIGLCLAYAFAFSWLFICIGLAAKTAQAANGFALMVFPFTFVSSAYVPADSMPGWLQVFARNQPVTAMIDAVRSLAIGSSSPVATHAITVSLVWTVVLAAVAAPIATWTFSRG